MAFFSVIVPVYKVEKYLKRCIDSILNQEFTDIEVILVDDGSPDMCGAICDLYAESDNRIIVVHKENGGLSSARNVGIRRATGKYLMFVDSDDYWDDNRGLVGIYEQLCNKPVDYLCMCATDEYYGTQKRVITGRGYKKEIFEKTDIYQVINEIFTSGYQPGAAWTAIIKREVVEKNKLYFTEGIKAEDIDWIINVMLHVGSINYCDDCFYVYMKGRKESITGTADLKSIKDILWIVDRWSTELLKDKYASVRQSLNTYLAYHLMCTVILYKRLPKEHKKEAKKEIARRKNILRGLNRRKVIIAAMIYKICGIKIASEILNMYHRGGR